MEELDSVQLTQEDIQNIVEPNMPQDISDTNTYSSDWLESAEMYYSDMYQDFDEITHRNMISGQYGVKLEDTDWNSKITFSGNTGSLSGKTIDMVADLKDTSPNNISVGKDIWEGFSNGCYEALRSIQEMGAWGGYKIAEAVAGEKIDFDPMKDTEGYGFNQGESPEAKTGWGSAAKIAGQVGTGLLLGGSTMKATKASKLSNFAKNSWGKKAINSIVSSATGFMTDTLSFSSNEANLADTLKSLGLPTIEAIAKSEDDSFWTKKIKNGVDGIMAGVLIDFIGKSAKMLYKATPKTIKAGVVAGTLSSDIKGE